MTHCKVCFDCEPLSCCHGHMWPAWFI